MWHICTHMEYYLALERREILTYAVMWMNLKGLILSEINQSQRDKCHIISLTGGETESTSQS